MKRMIKFIAFLITSISLVCFAEEKPTDPLPSWNDGAIKQSIINFVQEVTNPASRYYVVPEKRIATFDNDGTLWVEKPMYTQALFIMDRLRALAPKHPEWKKQQPYKAVLDGDLEAQRRFSLQDYGKVLAAANNDVTVDNNQELASNWLSITKNPRYHVLYTQLIYQPMLEVINYLNKNNFTVYIVTGGGQEFVRSFANSVYHIPLERVVGSTTKTNYIYKDGHPVLMNTADLLFISDKQGKPEAINLFIGQKPLIAFGNSDGDRQMLEWTEANPNKHLMVLVHHDDAEREYAYGPESKVGTFSTSLMQEAIHHGWKVVSMKNDWKVIFPFEKAKTKEKNIEKMTETL